MTATLVVHEPKFCGVGESCKTRDLTEALQVLKLNFTVSQHQNVIIDKKAKVKLDTTPDGNPCLVLDIPSEFNGLHFLDQAPLVRDDTHQVITNMGAGYQILQNSECAGIIEDILRDEPEIHITHGGTIKGCERCFLVAKLPKPIKVGPDRIEKYIVLHWSHNGRSALTIRFSPVLVTRGNGIFLDTFSGKYKHEFKIRHTKSGQKRVKEASNVLFQARKYFEDIEDVFHRLMDTPFDKDAMDKYLNILFPEKNEDEVKPRKSRNEPKRQAVMELFKDNEDVCDTRWAAFTAVCIHVDEQTTIKASRKDRSHGKPKFQKEEMRLDSIWFGTGAKVKASAFRELEKLTL